MPTPMDHLLSDTVTVAAYSGVSAGGSGDPTFGAQTTVAARVEHKTKLVKMADGVERQADHVIVSNAEIGLNDRVWLPGDDTTKTAESRKPVMVNRASVPSGAWTLYETWL